VKGFLTNNHPVECLIVAWYNSCVSNNGHSFNRVGIYCRVSTDKQDINGQLLPLREFAISRNFVIKGEYLDIAVSGTKSQRPALDALLKAARARQIDIVLVSKFDRFARSISHLINALEEFQYLGVDFISMTQAIDTSTPMGKMMFTVIAAVAEIERELIVERIQSGVDRARDQGKSLGRPYVIFDREKALELHRDKFSINKIAKTLGVSRETIRKTINGRKGN